ncbi:hypothetical protein JTB14_025474, partial [Gonioctena quinquepunctata]
IHLDDAKISLEGFLSMKGGLKFSNLVVVLTVGDITFDLNGLLDNTEFSVLASVVLTDTVPDFINTNHQVITDIISPIVEQVLNSVLVPKSRQYSLERGNEI